MASVVAVNPKQLPVTLTIGMGKAFDEGYAYNYVFVDRIGMYVCVITRQLPRFLAKSWPLRLLWMSR